VRSPQAGGYDDEVVRSGVRGEAVSDGRTTHSDGTAFEERASYSRAVRVGPSRRRQRHRRDRAGRRSPSR
jgi:hypothetical protein